MPSTYAVARPLPAPAQLLLSFIAVTAAHVRSLFTRSAAQIDTKTVIGPKAPKPLQVGIPILITAMSYGGALSVQAKVALAKGANLAGTATNTGESYLPEERQAAERLIMQHHRGLWPNSTMNRPELPKNADAIELQLGQGAQAAAAMKTKPTSEKMINARMREVFGLDPGEIDEISTRFRGVGSPGDFVDMVQRLKSEHPVPVGVKLGVSDYIEEVAAGPGQSAQTHLRW